MSKLVLLILMALVAFRCSPVMENREDEAKIDKLTTITDAEIAAFKTAIHKQTSNVSYKYFGKYKNYNFFNDLPAELQKQFVKELNLKPLEDLSFIQKVYDLNLSKTDVERLKERIVKIPVNILNGAKFPDCDFCFDYRQTVYWDTFWALQDAGDDMYAAHRGATIASIYAYNGCMYGCTTGRNNSETITFKNQFI